MSDNIFSMTTGSSREGGLAQVIAGTAMATTRQAQEVQAAMVVAKQFPRNEELAMGRILNACKRPTLAEKAIYSFPRGGTDVTGPSIDLAKAVAQAWGNVDFGFWEAARRKGESDVTAYAWDLETNTRESITFTVQHIRETKNGNYALTDPRDIYEAVANQAARRMRACILSVIPGDVVDAAQRACEQTLRKGSKKPIEQRRAEMAEKFDGGYGVTVDALEGFIGKRIDAFTEADIVRLGKIYRALEDGVAGSEEVLEKLRNAGQTAKPAAKRGAPAASSEPGVQSSEGTLDAAGGGRPQAAPTDTEDEEEVSLDDL